MTVTRPHLTPDLIELAKQAHELTKRPKRVKKTRKSAGKSPALIPQAHGGALLSGGLVGNKGNPNAPGRPPDAIRATMRQHLDVDVLADMMNDYRSGKADKIRVAEFLARYGLGTKDEVDVRSMPEVQKLVSNLARATVEVFGAEGYKKLSDRITELENS